MASDWPRTFFIARLFLFSISLLFVSIQKQNILSPDKKPQFLHPGCFLIAYGYFVEAYETDASLKSYIEKLKPEIFLNF